MSKKKKAIILTVICIFAIVMSGGLYVWQKYSTIYHEDDNKRIESRKKDPNKYKEVEGITNILLVGVDTRKDGEVSHSDALTILTIDDIHKKVKLTSLMRDSWVDIPGYSKEKLTHAHGYGGIDLLRDTIEENFDIRLDKYATIDFDGFKELINAVGGLELEIKNEEELKELNRCIILEVDDNPSLSKKDAVYLDKIGSQLMNGQQALAFSRMRYVGNGTYDRVRRQREVLEKLLNKVKETSIMKYPSLAESILPYLKTNVPLTESLNLAYTISTMDDFKVEKLQIPTDKLSEGVTVSRRVGWVHVMDCEGNKKVLHDFIFNDKPYEEKKYEQFKYTGTRMNSESTEKTTDEGKVESPSKGNVNVKQETKPESKPKPQPKPEPKPQSKPESKPEPKPESKPQPKPQPKPEPEPKPVSESKPKVDTENN